MADVPELPRQETWDTVTPRRSTVDAGDAASEYTESGAGTARTSASLDGSVTDADGTT